MRILVIVHGFPPASAGGCEIYARAHALALRRRNGDRVQVLTREADPAREEYAQRMEEQDGLSVRWVNNTFRRVRAFEESYACEAIDAIAGKVIDDFAPDVAHIHHLTCLSTGIVRALAERGVPSIMTLHDYWLICHRGQLLDVDYRLCDGPGPDGCSACLGSAGGAGAAAFAAASGMRALEERLPGVRVDRLRRAASRAAALMRTNQTSRTEARRRVDHMREICAQVTRFVAPSREMRDRFVRFGVASARISVGPYGYDRTPFRGVSRTTSNRLRLGFLGSVMASKAPHLLLEAIQRLPRDSVSVDLYGGFAAYHGDDSYRSLIEALADRENVRVHGAIPHERVAQALASLDVLVVPSIWPENSPLVIGEAFLAGVPVVASRIGGIPEVVSDGRNGLLFRPGDVGDLTAALRRLLEERGLIEALRDGVRAAHVPSIGSDVERTRLLYAEAIGAPPRRRRVAAVVLNYRAGRDTLLAVKSLLASRHPLDQIIVVDNDPGDDGRKALVGVASRITYLRAGRNRGFSGGMNLGIREALGRGAERVLLVNSDVIVTPDCLERLERCLDATPGCGIAGPVVLARSEPDRVASLGIGYRPRTGRMRHRGFGQRLDGRRMPATGAVDGVSGCLMLVAREVFDAAGYFDEDYFFSFEDLDFCLRARRAGYATVLAGLAATHHEGGRSIGARSPRRLYFAARGHLLLARRAGPPAGRLASALRTCSIVLLNLAHAVVSPGASLPTRIAAVARGTRDYCVGRFGPDPEAG
jgi:GT2 family glycosyltransferase/glycosyltransferase involved in cell wall biosynthesis